MSKNEEIQKFLQSLSEYYAQENDLSNIVVALCNSILAFREKFISFFFPSIDISKIESIRREVPDSNNSGSRVDIHISMIDETEPYIIEVKKGDRNHHFGQYEEAYGIGRERFGYITNYECHEGKELGYDVRTWEECYDHISQSRDEDYILSGFAEYLKSVCGIVKYDSPMNLSGLTAIPCFADACKKVIDSGSLSALTRFYRNYIYTESLQVGFTFKYLEESDLDGFGVIGLWFYEMPVITFGITSRQWLSEKIMANEAKLSKVCKYTKKIYRDCYWQKYDVWFDMSDAKMEEFMSAATFDEQVGILRAFIDDILQNLRPYFD